jgi:hypothetical protein
MGSFCLPESLHDLELRMSTEPNPYEPTSPVESDINAQTSLVATRVTSAVLVAVVMVCAAAQFLVGVVDVLTASPPTMEKSESGLFRDLTEVSASIYPEKRVRGSVSIAAGVLFYVIGVGLWVCRRRFLSRSRDAISGDYARRLALYGLAGALLGVLVHETLGGVISYSFTLGFKKCLAFLVLLCFGASLLSFASARDNGLPVRRAFPLYLFAILGAAISAYALIFWLLRFARELLWQIQMFT